MNPHHVKFHTHTRAFSEDLALEFSHPYVIILHTTLINLIRQILLFYENQREEKVEGENQQPTTTTTFQGGKHTPPESKEKKNFLRIHLFCCSLQLNHQSFHLHSLDLKNHPHF